MIIRLFEKEVIDIWFWGDDEVMGMKEGVDRSICMNIWIFRVYDGV